MATNSVKNLQKLRILTLNCWGLPDFITKLVYKRYKNPQISKGRKWPSRKDRFKAIAQKLDSYDIVCLQEVWIESDQEFLKKACKEKGLIYSHVFSSGMIGSSGLQIISRYPIREVYFHRYRVNGHVLRVDHGDYHAGKGFGFCRISVSDSQDVCIINTHTIAQYQMEDQYQSDRITQMWELIRFVQLTSKPNQPIIILGDMNCRPDSMEYQLLTRIGHVNDSFGEYLKRLKIKDDKGTTLMESSLMATIKSKSPRIDHIFYEKKKGIRLVDSKIVINDDDLIYSDHFGICSTFEITTNSSQSKASKLKNKLSIESSLTTNEVEVDDEEEEMTIDNSNTIGSKLLHECSQVIKKGTLFAQKRKTGHLIRCVVSIMVLWLFISLNAPSPWIGAISVYMAVEFFIAMFVVENDLAALREAHKEMHYHIH